MSILEGDKVKLHSGDTAWISEVLGDGDVFIAEVFKRGEKACVEQIERFHIAAKIIEIEQPLTA